MRRLSFALLVSLTLLLIPSAGSADGGYVGLVTVTMLQVSAPGSSLVGIATKPSDACSYWGYYFTFDATTAGGKAMYAALLSAKLSGNRVDLWYTPSANGAIDHTTGCNVSAMATLSGVAFR